MVISPKGTWAYMVPAAAAAEKGGHGGGALHKGGGGAILACPFPSPRLDSRWQMGHTPFSKTKTGQGSVHGALVTLSYLLGLEDSLSSKESVIHC